MPLHTGQMVTPALRLVRILRRGGMGSIWVADRLSLKAQVAVKFMSPELAEDPGYVERFRREAVAAAQITSPHVAQVLDHGLTSEGMPYIAMELLRGEDLRARIRRLGPLPLPEVARIVTQTAKALGQAHRLGIVHRDIKPDNLFLTEVDGETFVKVLDFGIAKRARDLRVTTTGNVVGTPLYMSPEQLISAKDLDFRADLWSLGVVAYHAITGQVPFFADSIVALTLVVHAGRFKPPSALRPDAPPALDDWMRRALQLDPSARFGSAREMADALDRALSPRRRSGGAPGLDTTQAPGLATAQGTGAESLVEARGANSQDGVITRRHPAPASMALADTDPCEGDATAERTTTVMMTMSSRKKRPSARLATVALLGAALAGAGIFLGVRYTATTADGAALAAVAARGAALPGTTEATLLASVVEAPRPLLAPEPTEPVRAAAAPPEEAAKTSETARPVSKKKPAARPSRSPGRGKPTPSAGRLTRRIKPFPRNDIAMHR
ncbi:serine/threonine-protein kinase [Sorangium sp. So ce388]|uniref:serine/threonine-protein kinase n=1 Tax=Sorangium sp. So ce388 TaxID=3133309 RepID=UPI003F5B9502